MSSASQFPSALLEDRHSTQYTILLGTESIFQTMPVCMCVLTSAQQMKRVSGPKSPQLTSTCYSSQTDFTANGVSKTWKGSPASPRAGKPLPEVSSSPVSTTFKASIDAELIQRTSDLSAPANGVRWTHLYTLHTAITNLTQNIFIILERTPALTKYHPLTPSLQPIPRHLFINPFLSINLLKCADTICNLFWLLITQYPDFKIPP